MNTVNEERSKVNLDKAIGKRIMAERAACKLSRDDLAELLDFSVPHLAMIERGERGATAMTLKKLSAIFNVPIDSLFAGTFNMAPITSDDLEQSKKKLEILVAGLDVVEVDFLIHMAQGLIDLARYKTHESA